MSKYSPKPSNLIGLGLSVPTILVGSVARSQSTDAQKEAEKEALRAATKEVQNTLPVAGKINQHLDKSYPKEILEHGDTPKPVAEVVPVVPGVATAPTHQGTAIGTSQYTFVLSTPALIAMVVILGGLAVFPLIHLLLNSKKVVAIITSSAWSKLADKAQKPRVLESDEFLHKRSVEKLAQITNQAENLNADKFGNGEFTAFFKIKSYIDRSMGEYANLDEIIKLLKIAIETQNSFAAIDSTESRYCSSSQQELYKFVNLRLVEGVEPELFKEEVELKLQEVLPKMKSDQGRIALEAYIVEVIKVSRHPLALKLLLLFKKHHLEDFSILRSVSTTINLLEAEDLLNLDKLLMLVMEKYDVFEKLGPIVGVAEEHNRPETYSKMLQYIGLKSRHEVSYQKFQEFLIILKQWEIHHKTVKNVRNKYSEKDYRIPKEFTADLPGAELYQRYKDNFHLIAVQKPVEIELIAPEVSVELAEAEIPVLTGAK